MQLQQTNGIDLCSQHARDNSNGKGRANNLNGVSQNEAFSREQMVNLFLEQYDRLPKRTIQKVFDFVEAQSTFGHFHRSENLPYPVSIQDKNIFYIQVPRMQYSRSTKHYKQWDAENYALRIDRLQGSISYVAVFAVTHWKYSLSDNRNRVKAAIRMAETRASFDLKSVVKTYHTVTYCSKNCVGGDPDRAYVFRELSRGSAVQFFKRSELKRGEVIRLGQQIAVGLKELHDNQLMYRALHPDRIFVLGQGVQTTFLLDDAGTICKAERGGEPGAFLGEQHYLPASVVKGLVPQQPKHDFYSLVVLLRDGWCKAVKAEGNGKFFQKSDIEANKFWLCSQQCQITNAEQVITWLTRISKQEREDRYLHNKALGVTNSQDCKAETLVVQPEIVKGLAESLLVEKLVKLDANLSNEEAGTILAYALEQVKHKRIGHLHRSQKIPRAVTIAERGVWYVHIPRNSQKRTKAGHTKELHVAWQLKLRGDLVELVAALKVGRRQNKQGELRSLATNRGHVKTAKRESKLKNKFGLTHVVETHHFVSYCSKGHAGPPDRAYMFQRLATWDGIDFFSRPELSREEVIWFWQQVVEGIQELHGKGLMHRDLKLDNILGFESDGKAIVLMGDVGTVCLERKGRPGEVCGAANFMPDVVAKGWVKQRQEHDIYALDKGLRITWQQASVRELNDQYFQKSKEKLDQLLLCIKESQITDAAEVAEWLNQILEQVKKDREAVPKSWFSVFT